MRQEMGRERVQFTQLLLLAFVGSVFLYQVVMNYQTYSMRDTAFSIYNEDQPRVPPLIFCPRPSLDVLRLLKFGLTLNTTHFQQAKYDLYYLSGIPENTSLVQLEKETSWSLGQVLKGLRFGDIQDIYQESTRISPRWGKVYLGGPCFVLKTPLDQNSTTVNVQVNTHFSDVNVSEYGLSDHPDGEALMRMALHLRTQLFRVELYVPALPNGYITRSLVEPKREVSRILEFASYSVQQLHWQKSDNPKICMENCLIKIARKFRMCFSVEPSASDVLQKPCTISSYFQDDIDCVQQCKGGYIEEKWRTIKRENKSGSLYAVKMHRKHKLLVEVEIYPLHNLLSDIGGSLGLFLGISLVTFGQSIIGLISYSLHCINEIRFRSFSHSQRCQHHVVQLSGFCVLLLIIFCTIFHLMTSVFEMNKLLVKTFVSLHGNNYSVYPSHTYGGSSDVVNDSEITNLIASRLASRAFRCRTSSMHNVFIDCLLGSDDVVNIIGIIPFLNIVDLPMCQNVTFKFPKIKFEVPYQIMEEIRNLNKLNQCYMNYKSKNAMPIDSEHLVEGSCKLDVFQEETSFFDSFVEFGGIISLYFGLSLLGMLNSEYWHYIIHKSLVGVLKIFKIFVGCLALCVSVYVCLSQVSNFLSRHPITIVPLSMPGSDKSALSISVCPWPPINTSALVELTLGQRLPSDYDSFELSLIMEKLVKVFSQNSSLFADVWNLAQWEATDIIRKYSKGDFHNCSKDIREDWQPIYVSGHKCFTYTPSGSDQQLYLIYTIGDISFYLTLHSSDELPFIRDVYHIKSHVFVKKVSKYINYDDGGGYTFGNCMQHCTNEHYGRHVFGTGRVTLNNSYNLSDIHKVLNWALHWPSVNHTHYPMLYSSKPVDEKCKINCRTTMKSFINVEFKPKVEKSHVPIFANEPSFTYYRMKVNTSLNVHVIHKSLSLYTQEIVKEHDGYSFSQLVSDAGSVIGITIGISVLSLTQTALRFGKTCTKHLSQMKVGR